MKLADQFGGIDIYLFDQLLRGNIAPGMRILDAGCGSGRNLVYLLREGYECYGVDGSVEAVEWVRAMAATLAPGLASTVAGGNFRVEGIEAMSFEAGVMDVVVCNSVLQFARDDEQFEGMVWGLWRTLRAGGMLFCRLASTIGGEFAPVEKADCARKFLLPDGTEWYLVDEDLLMRLTEALGGELLDPLKTTVVQGSRCMTTWVVQKGTPR
jgi:2-polyprenyl-3-methyl-5-hydroxy-6-metoxy-1,4-benzoquinol methylase